MEANRQFTPRQKQIQFFQEHAGYCTPPGRMACAKALADAETLADELDLHVTWEYEQEPWLEFAGEPEDEYRRNFESGKWECLYAYIDDVCGHRLASLGGIVLNANGERNYRRVVEAELKAEAIATLKAGGR